MKPGSTLSWAVLASATLALLATGACSIGPTAELQVQNRSAQTMTAVIRVGRQELGPLSLSPGAQVILPFRAYKEGPYEVILSRADGQRLTKSIGFLREKLVYRDRLEIRDGALELISHVGSDENRDSMLESIFTKELQWPVLSR